MGTGFSDEQLVKHHQFLQQHVIDKPRSYYRYGDSVEPDHWFDAVQVIDLFRAWRHSLVFTQFNQCMLGFKILQTTDYSLLQDGPRHYFKIAVTANPPHYSAEITQGNAFPFVS